MDYNNDGSESLQKKKFKGDPRDETLLVSAVLPALTYGVLRSSFDVSSGKALLISGLIGISIFFSDKFQPRSVYEKFKVVGNDFFSTIRLLPNNDTSVRVNNYE
jgi:hypothetical protein